MKLEVSLAISRPRPWISVTCSGVRDILLALLNINIQKMQFMNFTLRMKVPGID